MEEKLKMRNEVDPQLTWDLSLLYASHEEVLEAVQKMEALSEQIYTEFAGKLTNSDKIINCLELYHEVYVLQSLTGNYVELAVSVDYYNNENRDLASRVENANAKISSKLSFIESELSQLDEDTLRNTAALSAKYCNYLQNVILKKPHLLHPEGERILTAISPTAQAPYEIYNTIKLADMKFDSFCAEGKSYPLGYSLFEDSYEYEPNTAVRREAFRVFSEKLHAYENSTAAAYNAHVQHSKITSVLRNFSSLEAQDLFHDRVESALYHRQIDIITDKLAPHMRKYAKLIQRVHQLDKMTYADLKLPIDPDFSPAISIDAAKKYVIDGLSVMGEEYGTLIKRAFSERWIDFAQNQGKSTGGFCASPYRKPSYILLSWNKKMSDVFTLAHELGHAGHFELCNQAQSIFDTEVSGYFVEAPSTLNELLMAHYLLKTNEDIRFRRWVLSNIVGNTYYHNFVTHLLEGAYQREVYRIVDNGGSLQAETLSSIMHDVLANFWGDAVELTPGAELTWMRQPHYYMGLYSYSYSAGLTIATQMCKRIETEGSAAVQDWKNVLAAGSTLTPVELAKLGGIDVTTDAALLDTIEIIGAYIDEICRLTDLLEEASLT